MKRIRLEILRFFVLNLAFYIQKTYLYSYRNVDLMNENDKINHFNWCFDKVLKDYQNNNVLIRKNEETLRNFYQIFKMFLYNKENKKEALNSLQSEINKEFKNRKSNIVIQMENILFENMGK